MRARPEPIADLAALKQSVRRKAAWPRSGAVSFLSPPATHVRPAAPPRLEMLEDSASMDLSPTEWSLLACALPMQQDEADAYAKQYRRWRASPPHWPLPPTQHIASAAHAFNRAYGESSSHAHLEPLERCWPLLFDSLLTASAPEQTLVAGTSGSYLELIVLRSNTLGVAVNILPAIHALARHDLLGDFAPRWLCTLDSLRAELTIASHAAGALPNSHVQLSISTLEASLRSLPDPALGTKLRRSLSSRAPNEAEPPSNELLLGHHLGDARRHRASRLWEPLRRMDGLVVHLSSESAGGPTKERLTLLHDVACAVFEESADAGGDGDGGGSELGRRTHCSFA